MPKETDRIDERNVRKRKLRKREPDTGQSGGWCDTTDVWSGIIIKHCPGSWICSAQRSCSPCRTHVVGEELQHEGGHAAVDPDEEVHAGEDHIGGAGDLEHEGGGVHERCDRPPGEAQRQMSTGCPPPSL